MTIVFYLSAPHFHERLKPIIPVDRLAVLGRDLVGEKMKITWHLLESLGISHSDGLRVKTPEKV